MPLSTFLRSLVELVRSHAMRGLPSPPPAPPPRDDERLRNEQRKLERMNAKLVEGVALMGRLHDEDRLALVLLRPRVLRGRGISTPTDETEPKGEEGSSDV